MRNLLWLLLSWIFVGVEGDPESDPAPGTDSGTDEPNPDDLGDGTPAGTDDADGATADEPGTEPADDGRTPAETVQGRGNREFARLREQRRADRARVAELEEQVRRLTPQGPSQDEQLFQQEEARLRDANCSDLEKWQIESSRTIRFARQSAEQARISSADSADAAAFYRDTADEKDIRKWAPLVEKRLAEMRSKGQNAPRMGVYTYLLGEALRNGRRNKPAAKPAAARPGALPADQRGQPRGARSDVQARGALTEHQKRMKRLENQIL